MTVFRWLLNQGRGRRQGRGCQARRLWLGLTVLAAGAHGLGAQLPEEPASGGPVRVATKPFAESLVLGEIFAQLLEARGFTVDRRPGLGSTEITFQALRSGEVDVYPEYTGTGLLVLLGEEVAGDGPEEVFRRVAREFRERWGIRWLAPLGFENTYAMAVRAETADSLALETLSELVPASPGLVAGFTPDFIGRSDGLVGLEGAYGMDFAEVRPLVQAVKYQALAEGSVDVIDGYSTDGALDRHELVVLRDDRGFFPPYQAAPLVRAGLVEERPGVAAALSELAGLLSEATMRRANRQLEVDGIPIPQVAGQVLASLGLTGPVAATPATRVQGPGQGLWTAAWERRGETLVLTGEHLVLVGLSLLAAILVAVPLGLGLTARPGLADLALRITGVFQTLPSIALLAFMIPLLGIGTLPAVTALFLYSLLPILRNTYAGVVEADPAAVRAGRALGMTPGQVLLQIRLPLAAPVIMAGIRTAAVINVGTATLAAFIGAGGLGEPIVSGLALSDTGLILSGAVPAAALALVVDGLLGVVERRVAPQGLREARSQRP